MTDDNDNIVEAADALGDFDDAQPSGDDELVAFPGKRIETGSNEVVGRKDCLGIGLRDAADEFVRTVAADEGAGLDHDRRCVDHRTLKLDRLALLRDLTIECRD